jgi:UDP-N-acetylmuramoyl-L-alanyl-D-glutamate--2,6-diaminopimelate ligase
MKSLERLLKNIKLIKTIGDLSVPISQLELDSRLCVSDSLFVALPGVQVDGHNYINKAIENGASVVVCERLPENLQENITYLQVKDSSTTLALLARNFYDHPSSKMKIVGITGTNGKTTTATFLFDLFRKLGKKVGLISTIDYRINEEIFPSTHTTPNAIKVQELFSKMQLAGCEYCFMEVSSHALDQKRVYGVDFDIAVFTNISRDHLDYHSSYNEYISCKKILFDQLKPEAYALVNMDDKHGETMVLHTKAQIRSYSLKQVSDYKTKVLETDINGSLILFNGVEVYTPTLGLHNMYNLTVCFAVAELFEVDKIDIFRILSILTPAKGRFQQVKSTTGKTAIVDYAHTPDALENILKAIIEIKSNTAQIITVVGCGGDRDKGKRPQMAKIACLYSNQVILTSDNPRTENPESIIEDMEKGIPSDKNGSTLSITNRSQAIKTAIRLASDSDIVLVAGKGHETYQEINGVKHHFDDVEEIEKYF